MDEAIPEHCHGDPKLDGSLRAAESHLSPLQGTFAHPPTIDEVVLAVEDLKKILHPPRRTDPELDVVFRNRLVRRHEPVYVDLH